MSEKVSVTHIAYGENTLTDCPPVRIGIFGREDYHQDRYLDLTWEQAERIFWQLAKALAERNDK